MKVSPNAWQADPRPAARLGPETEVEAGAPSRVLPDGLGPSRVRLLGAGVVGGGPHGPPSCGAPLRAGRRPRTCRLVGPGDGAVSAVLIPVFPRAST